MRRFVIRSVDSGLKFDLRADNGERILTSEVYATPAACRKGIASIRRNAPAAPLAEPEDGPVPNPKFELYRDRADRFRFRLRAKNGKIIAVSEGYTSRAGCLNGVLSVKKCAPDALIMKEEPL